MTETLIHDPVATYHHTSLRKPGAVYEAGSLVPKLPDMGLLALRVQLMLEEDIREETQQLENLPQKAQRFVRRGAVLALTTYLNSRAIPMPRLNHDSEQA